MSKFSFLIILGVLSINPCLAFARTKPCTAFLTEIREYPNTAPSSNSTGQCKADYAACHEALRLEADNTVALSALGECCPLDFVWDFTNSTCKPMHHPDRSTLFGRMAPDNISLDPCALQHSPAYCDPPGESGS